MEYSNIIITQSVFLNGTLNTDLASIIILTMHSIPSSSVLCANPSTCNYHNRRLQLPSLTKPFQWNFRQRNNGFQAVSLIPYTRRLVCTGNGTHINLACFFGSFWQSGIGRLHENKRGNYLRCKKFALGPSEIVL